jgi:hypothetical protein
MESLRRIKTCTASQSRAARRNAVRVEMWSSTSDCLESSSPVALFMAAIGFLREQVGGSVDDAIDLLMDRADADRRAIGDVAIDIVEGRTHFNI